MTRQTLALDIFEMHARLFEAVAAHREAKKQLVLSFVG
jgi:hypothetical protein